MAIDPIGGASNVDALMQVNSNRVRMSTEQKELPPAPASSVAVPIDTARAQVNQLSMLPAMMAPTADGLFIIGGVSVKPIKVRAISSSWGF